LQTFPKCSYCQEICVSNKQKIIRKIRHFQLRLKLLAIAGTLIERPIIKEDFDGKYKVLLVQFDIELSQAKTIFDNSQADPPLHKNQPPTAGRLKWANELLRRIREPRERFNLIDHPLIQSEEALIVFKKYDQMVELINGFKAEFKIIYHGPKYTLCHILSKKRD